VSHYQAIAHRVGSSDALELGHRLSSWHDRMVAHERLARSSPRRCHDTCPHAEAIDLWQGALEVLGDVAESLTFLKTMAANAVRSTSAGGTREERQPVTVDAG
jgi:hypothetical protein